MLTLSLLVDMFVHLQRNFVTCSYLSHKQLPVSFKLRWISLFLDSHLFLDRLLQHSCTLDQLETSQHFSVTSAVPLVIKGSKASPKHQFSVMIFFLVS